MGGGDDKQSTNIDPRMMKLYEQNYEFAQDVAGQPYQPYTGARQAGFNPAQQAGFDLSAAQGIQGGYSQLQGLGLINRMASGNAGADIAAQMNPFQQQVTNRTMGDIERQRLMQTQQIGDRATQANAFGGSRHGVNESLTNEAALRTGADYTANANYQNYANAQSQLQNLGMTQMTQGRQGLADMFQTGGLQQQFQQQGLNQEYQDFLEARDYPLKQLQILNSGLSQMPVGTSTTQSGGGGLSGAGALGGGLGAAAVASGPYAPAIIAGGAILGSGLLG